MIGPFRGLDEYRTARDRMVRLEAEEKGIADGQLLDALRRVPRHRFADEALAGRAYGGHTLPIGWGQTLSQPYMVARMTEALEPRSGDRVLEVGTGSGYQAALLARLGCRVFTIERIPELARRARRILDEIGASSVCVMTGDGSIGWKEYAPFERILVTAGAPSIPEELLAQLADPGILVSPLGGESQELVIVRREGGREKKRVLEPCRFVPLVRGNGPLRANGPAGRSRR